MDPPPMSRPKLFRRKYLIDRPDQLRLIGQLLLGLVLLTAANVAGLYIALDDDSISSMHPTMHDALVEAILGFFLVASIMIVLLGIILTHRFVGPAYVMRTAVEGMLTGDYSRRLTLRKGDYLQSLAAKLAQLRDHYAAREREVSTAVAEAERCIAAHDLAGASAALHALESFGRPLAGTVSEQAAPAPESSPASSPRQPVEA